MPLNEDTGGIPTCAYCHGEVVGDVEVLYGFCSTRCAKYFSRFQALTPIPA